MKRHLLFTLTLSLFYFYSAWANQLDVKRIPSDSNKWGFRCGLAIFSSELIDAAFQTAFVEFQAAALSSPGEKNSHPYPKVYLGTLGLGDDKNYLLWPLQDPRLPNASPENTPQHEIEPPSYMLVIGGTNFEVLGVIELFRLRNSFVKCVKEYDLSRMTGQLVAAFQCPIDVFSAKVIMTAVESATKALHKRKQINTLRKFPILFEQQLMFGPSSPLFSWPVCTSGIFCFVAYTSIIIDENYNFIGMVHRRQSYNGGRDKYLKCKVSSHEQHTFKFIQSDILRELPKPNTPETVDVFDCKTGLIRADLAMQDAADLPQGFKLKATDLSRRFPKFFGESQGSNSQESSEVESLYLSPVNVEGKSVFKFTPGRKYLEKLKFFLVVNDFSEILGVVKSLPKFQYEPCWLKTVTWEYYNLQKDLSKQWKNRYQATVEKKELY